VLHFEIDNFRKNALLQGLDNIGWTLSHDDEIAVYENKREKETPWLF
jgi:3-isopropylmalate/(R)-2-methylmalate dehydratase small subunit